jgi:hypothetical protein
VGFVVRIASKLSRPRWLIADRDGAPGDFGPRELAIVFPTRETAEAQAKHWSAVLEPAIAVAVEPAEDSA